MSINKKVIISLSILLLGAIALSTFSLFNPVEAKGTLPDEIYTSDYLEQKDKDKVDKEKEGEILKTIKKVWKKDKPKNNKFVIGEVLERTSYQLFTVYAPTKDIEHGGIIGYSESVILIKSNPPLVFLTSDPASIPEINKISKDELNGEQRNVFFGEAQKQYAKSWFFVNAEAIQNVSYKFPYGNGKSFDVWQGPHGCNGATVATSTECGFDLGISNVTNDGNIYAFANGIVTKCVICMSSAYIRIKDTDANSARYVHLENNSNLITGITQNLTQITQGTKLGNVKAGTFTDTGSCGYTSELDGTGHVHYYVTIPLAIESATFNASGPTSGTYTSTNGSGCTPPASGTWFVSASCDFTGSANVTGGIYVQNNTTLRIIAGASLDVNFTSYNVKAQTGSKIIIESGGKIY
ncbi:MAG: hypothetical protein H7196_04940 [candidate division SR1 bacterium]|nr:hypothetical protein [candidate division SR1 bacterium]